MKTYKEQGIVLHTVRYGDSSLVVYMLTRGLGRQTYMVQGVRSTKGKGNKAALFQPMFIVEFEGLVTPKAEMHRLKDVRAAYAMKGIPFDVRKGTIALFMAEVLYRLIREVEPESPLFGFVAESVRELDAMGEGVANFHLWFLVRLSYFLGFWPGNEYSQGDWFDIAGGLFTPLRPDGRLSLSPRNAALLDEMINIPVGEIGSVKLSREARSEFMTGILSYFGYHLDAVHNIRSLQILRDVF